MQYTSLWVLKALHNAGPARLTTIWRFWQTEITGYLSLDFKYVTMRKIIFMSFFKYLEKIYIFRHYNVFAHCCEQFSTGTD